jgi:hypothetical protein
MTDAPIADPAPAEPPLPPPVAPALVLLERGDNRGAHALLRQLLADKPAPDVEQAARALADRLAPDPRALTLGLATLALLALLVAVYVV